MAHLLPAHFCATWRKYRCKDSELPLPGLWTRHPSRGPHPWITTLSRSECRFSYFPSLSTKVSFPVESPMRVGKRALGHHTVSPHTVPTTQCVLNQWLWDEDINEWKEVMLALSQVMIMSHLGPLETLFSVSCLHPFGGRSTTAPAALLPFLSPQYPLYPE